MTEKQDSLFDKKESERLKIEGMQKAEDAAGREFVDWCYIECIRLLSLRGWLCSDHLRKSIENNGIVIHHSNALGSVFRKLACNDVCFDSGLTVRSKRKVAHRAKQAVWIKKGLLLKHVESDIEYWKKQD